MGDVRFIAWAGYDFKGCPTSDTGDTEYIPVCYPDVISDEQGVLSIEADESAPSPSVDASELKPKVTATT